MSIDDARSIFEMPWRRMKKLPRRRTAFLLMLCSLALLSYSKAASADDFVLTRESVKVKLSYFSRLLKIEPGNAEAHFLRSRCYCALHDYKAQLEDLRAAIPVFQKMRNDPINRDRQEIFTRYLQFCYQDAGAVCQNLKMYKQSLLDFSNAIKENPHERQLYKIRSEVYARLGDKVAAKRDIEKADSMPDTEAAEENFYRGILVVQKQIKEQLPMEDAINHCNSCLQFRPDSVLALSYREKLYLQSGKFSLALKDLEQLAKLQPDNKQWLLEKERLQRLRKDYPQADRDQTVSTAQQSDAQNLSKIAQDANSKLSQLNAYIQKHPGDIRGYTARVDYFLRMNKTRDAVSDLNTIISIDPTNFRAIKTRARCFAALNEKQKSLADFGKALDMVDEVAEGSLMRLEGREEIIFARAQALSRFGNNLEAINDYNKVLALEPDSEEAYRYRGDCYKKLGNLDQALKDYTNSIQRDAESAGSSYRARADIYEKMGKAALAKQDREKAHSLGF